MALLEMKKIRVATHLEDVSKVLETVQKLGLMEFTEISPTLDLKKKEKVSFQFNYVSSRLDFAVNFLSKYQKVSFLKKALEDQRVYVKEEEMERLAQSFYFDEVIEEISELEAKESEAKQKIQQLIEEEKALEEWRGLDIPLKASFETEKTATLLFRISKTDRDFILAIEEQKVIYNLDKVGQRNYALTVLKKDLSAVNSFLKKRNVEFVQLSLRRGTPAEEIERIERAKIKEEKTLVFCGEKAYKLAKAYLKDIKILSDYIFWKKQKDDVLLNSSGTDKVVILEGWCPVKKFEYLKNDLEKTSKLVAIEELEVGKEENPPVEIENNRFFKPFETITRLYGLPSFRDIDPTLFLSGFFFIFFGLSLTDVGYGLTLLVVVGLILTFYKIPKESKPLFLLLMLGGLASIIVGIFFGGYLGIDASLLPSWLSSLQFFDPISSPIPVFYLSLVLGVCQVMVGLFLGIFSEAKQGRLKDGIFDHGSWLLLFFAIIISVGAFAKLWSPSPLFAWFIYLSLFLIVLSKGRKEKGIIKKVFFGLLGLYGFINYFSDVLSYSRLLALGLATSALAFAVNLIALLARDMIPIIGPILMVIILIVGHLFNLLVNVLGAFIHSARLQFVEFFGKFLTGSGRNFMPFRQEERNVVITKS